MPMYFADQINGKNIYKIFIQASQAVSWLLRMPTSLTPETVEMLDKAMEVQYRRTHCDH